MHALLIAAAVAAAPPAGTRTASADYWPNSSGNQYQANPMIARRLRCAALIEAVGQIYFGAAGFDADPRLRAGLDEVTFETPRMPAADKRERQAYAQAVHTLYDAAEALGRSRPKYSHGDFHGWYGDSNRREALDKVRAGLGFAALASPVVRCFEYPQIAAARAQLAARLQLPLPERMPTASPRIQPGWLPPRTIGYLYKPDSFRFLMCAGIAHAAAEARYGAMPLPDGADHGASGRADPGRALFRKAVRDTFLAGYKTLTANSAPERHAYIMSFHAAVPSGKTLVKNQLAGEAMREPALRCADLPSMAPVVPLLG